MLSKICIIQKKVVTLPPEFCIFEQLVCEEVISDNMFGIFLPMQQRPYTSHP